MHVEPFTPEDKVEIESSKENVAGAILVFSEMVGTSSFRSGGVLNMKDLLWVRVNYHIIKSILTNAKSNKQNQNVRNKTHPALFLIGLEKALNWNSASSLRSLSCLLVSLLRSGCEPGSCMFTADKANVLSALVPYLLFRR